jgi:hypothetical protein
VLSNVSTEAFRAVADLKLHHVLFLSAIGRRVLVLQRPVWAFEVAIEAEVQKTVARSLLNYLRRGGFVRLVDRAKPDLDSRIQSRYVLTSPGQRVASRGESCEVCRVNPPEVEYGRRLLCRSCLCGYGSDQRTMRQQFESGNNASSALGWCKRDDD